MNMQNHNAFRPAIYCCSWCEITSHGVPEHLPMGWDKCLYPGDETITLSCPDCNERNEQEYRAAGHLMHLKMRVGGMVSATVIMGRVAASYAGGLHHGA